MIPADRPVYMISVAAELAGMHPQTLRQYDRLGLVTPQRSAGRGRRYSADDIEKLQLVQRLSQDDGINLEGIKRILRMREEIEAMRREQEAMRAEMDAMRRRLETAGRIFAAASSGDVVSLFEDSQGAGRRARPARRIAGVLMPGTSSRRTR
ncbi:MerR family transcriptional regulator [Brevibacterium sp. HMSC08F02]|uniref:MerR family DNA-binding transcriptional regulator n=3 Tax=Brevibacterium TaxID=1696 RepID=A0A2I1II18_9MICO|nr:MULTISPECIES: helix-turn-helix transcriptional regulator [Brevibacterium]MCG7301345.1 helix-turn-helix transcriptional regulator [Brevibacterium ravenspurgense]OFT25946.1 MerR family transcriptional regulator [Brevibacterium sp. HMSC08F02]OFT93589.1 MerR family transcriptional regulator [Brevibacterium sp. HMSC24B04]OFT96050.1 MerR family transcriptional regulator [Brevibacterium sp. HMSC22B09]PKY70775.1 MerR family DNA-binding transcriptional regulator [Brevibacterium ravenspurgense]